MEEKNIKIKSHVFTGASYNVLGTIILVFFHAQQRFELNQTCSLIGRYNPHIIYTVLTNENWRVQAKCFQTHSLKTKINQIENLCLFTNIGLTMRDISSNEVKEIVNIVCHIWRSCDSLLPRDYWWRKHREIKTVKNDIDWDKLNDQMRYHVWIASTVCTTAVKGKLWDRRWSPPSIRIYPHTCWFIYRNAFLIMKVSKLPNFRVIRAPIASQSTFKNKML